MKELCILGGNVAGLSSAILMKEQHPEINIRVYDKSFSSNKPCGGIIPESFVEELASHQVYLKEKHRCNEFIIGTMKGTKTVSFDCPLSLVTTRRELQQALATRARNLSVELIEKRVMLKDGNSFTPQTVVATGYSGLTGLLLGREWREKDTAQIYRFDGAQRSNLEDKMIILYDPAIFDYGWYFKGDGFHVNLGFGSPASPETNYQRYQDFLAILKNRFYIAFDNLPEPSSWILPAPLHKNYPLSSHRTIRWFGESNTLLEHSTNEFVGVGDAIGVAHPVSGEGIEPSWRSSAALVSSYDGSTFKIPEYSKSLRQLQKTQVSFFDRQAIKLLRSRFYSKMPCNERIILKAAKRLIEKRRREITAKWCEKC